MPRPRGLKKTDSTTNRPKQIFIRLTEDEDNAIYEAVDRHKASLQYWARTRLLAVAKLESENNDTAQLLLELIEELETAADAEDVKAEG